MTRAVNAATLTKAGDIASVLYDRVFNHILISAIYRRMEIKQICIIGEVH